MARATPFDRFEGFPIEWITFAERKKGGSLITFEVPVVSICAWSPCGSCFQCGIAAAYRTIARLKEKGKL